MGKAERQSARRSVKAAAETSRAEFAEPETSRGVSPRNTLNDLSAKEWLSESVSVWTQRGLGSSHEDAQIERLHPAPFSFTDVARLIRMFTKQGMTVLDPFAGVGSTLKAAALEGRFGVGIELYDDFVDLIKRRLREEVPTAALRAYPQTVYEGDSRVVSGKLDTESVDFIVTSPPYWSILNKRPDHKVKSRLSEGLSLNYGADPRDLGNIGDYQEFVADLAETLRLCARALRRGRYMALVVGDFRHGNRYHMFHADIARAMEERGFVLNAVNVLYQRHKRVFPYGYPAAYVANVHHQNIIILRKAQR